MFQKWRTYESERIRRAWKETKWTTFLGWSLFTGSLGLLGQWKTGVQSEHDALVKIGVAFGCAVIGLLLALFFKFISLPATMAAEQKETIDSTVLNHNTQLDRIKGSHASAIQILEQENQRLKTEIEDYSIKLTVTASLSLEHTDTKHGLLTIKALNSGTKVARVRRVAVLLVPNGHPLAAGVTHVSAELNIGQNNPVVQIQGDDDIHEWQQVLRFKPNFQIHEREGEPYGKGYVELTSGKKVEFEFILLPNDAWNFLSTPLPQELGGKVGHKCPHCGRVVLINEDTTSYRCPQCAHEVQVKPATPKQPIGGKQYEAIRAIHSAMQPMLRKWQNCTHLLGDDELEWRERAREFHHDRDSFGKAFDENKIAISDEQFLREILQVANKMQEFVSRMERAIIFQRNYAGNASMIKQHMMPIEALELEIPQMQLALEKKIRGILTGNPD